MLNKLKNLFKKSDEKLTIKLCKCGCSASVYKNNKRKYRCGCMDSDCNYSILWFGDEYRTAEKAVIEWNKSIATHE